MFFIQILLVTGLKTVFHIQQQDLSLTCGPSTPKLIKICYVVFKLLHYHTHIQLNQCHNPSCQE